MPKGPAPRRGAGPLSTSMKRPSKRGTLQILFEFSYHFSRLYLLAFRNIDLLYRSLSCGKYIGLHLHGLDDSDRLLFLNRIALFDEDSDDVARDVGSDFHRIILVGIED